ncbi:MAG: hypothetical protein DI586_03030 [Micavibrio aeruginosavorus]|uniref:Serine aminopeptidase S33 domain-containing protein n=1 Tax=Micavibrio aeruginosavorus TaxID=349221 RepID=A0A2W5HSN9_9BACT|nr:MAG: hypothetical protein DI586_03030 [Micavibrio aeruginosavorus]
MAFSKDGLPQIREDFKKARQQPEGWTSNYFINADQEKIFYAKIPALPSTSPVKGSVVMTTGYGDSIYNEYDSIREWQERGYDVYAMDWASQGFSQRNPDHPNRPSSRPLSYHVRDLDQFVHHVVEPQANRPLILSTHSMGGAIGAMYLKEHPGIFDKAVLAAPMLDLDTSILPREWFKNIAHVAKNIGLKNMSLPNWRDTIYDIKNFSMGRGKLSDTFSATVNDDYKPYELKLPSWGWVTSAYAAMDKTAKPDFFHNIKANILFVSAGHDELVDNKIIENAARTAPNGQLLHLPEAQHSIRSASQKDKETLWRNIDNLLENSNKMQPITRHEIKNHKSLISGQDLQPAFG